MSTPQLDDRPQSYGSGWYANDLHLDDIRRLLDRFIRNFEPGTPDQCWLWQGSRTPGGYGILARSRRAALLAHRISWVAFTGQALSDDLTIDHLCATKLCVNPSHLEPVTLDENLRRMRERRLSSRPVDWAPSRKRRARCELCDKSLLVSSMAYHVTSANHVQRAAV